MRRIESKQVSFSKGMIENIKQESLTANGQAVSLLYTENYNPNIETNSLVLRQGYMPVLLNGVYSPTEDPNDWLSERTIMEMFENTEHTRPMSNYSVLQTKGLKSHWSRILFIKERRPASLAGIDYLPTALFADIPTNYPLLHLLSYSYYWHLNLANQLDLNPGWYNVYDWFLSQAKSVNSPYGIVPIGHFSDSKNYGQAVYFNTLPEDSLYTDDLAPYHRLAYKWSFFDYTKKREDNNLWWNGLSVAGVTGSLTDKKLELTGWKVWDNQLPIDKDVTWYASKTFGLCYIGFVPDYKPIVISDGLLWVSYDGELVGINEAIYEGSSWHRLTDTFIAEIEAHADGGDAVDYWGDMIIYVSSSSYWGVKQTTFKKIGGQWYIAQFEKDVTFEPQYRAGIYQDGKFNNTVYTTKTGTGSFFEALSLDTRAIRIGVSIVPTAIIDTVYHTNGEELLFPSKISVSTMELPNDSNLTTVMKQALDVETQAYRNRKTSQMIYTRTWGDGFLGIDTHTDYARKETIEETAVLLERLYKILPVAKLEDLKDIRYGNTGFEECWCVIPLTLNNYIENKTSRSWLGHEIFAMLLTIEIEGIEYIISQNVLDMNELHKIPNGTTAVEKMKEAIGEFGLLPVARAATIPNANTEAFEFISHDLVDPSIGAHLAAVTEREDERRGHRRDYYVQTSQSSGEKTIRRAYIEYPNTIQTNQDFPIIVGGNDMAIEVKDLNHQSEGILHSKNGFTTNNTFKRTANDERDKLAQVHLRVDLSIDKAMLNKLTDMNAGSLKVYMQKPNGGSSFRMTGVYSEIESPPVLYHFYDKNKYKKDDYSNYGLVFKAGIAERQTTPNKNTHTLADAVRSNWQTKWHKDTDDRYYATGMDGTFSKDNILDNVNSTKQIILDYPTDSEVLNLGGSGQYLETIGSEFIEVIKGVFFFAGLRDKYNVEVSNDVYWGVIQDGKCSYFATYKENKIAFGALPVTALINFREHLVVFNRNEFYRMQLPEPFNPATWEVIDKNKGQGTFSPRTACVTPYGVCFANENGIWISDGGKPKSLTDDPNAGLSIYSTYAEMMIKDAFAYSVKEEPRSWGVTLNEAFNSEAELIYDATKDELVLSCEAQIPSTSDRRLLVKLIYSFKYANWRVDTIPLPVILYSGVSGDYPSTVMGNYPETSFDITLNDYARKTNFIRSGEGYGRHTAYGEGLETLTYGTNFASVSVLPQIITSSNSRTFDAYYSFNYDFWACFYFAFLTNVGLPGKNTYIQGILASHTFGDYENDFILKQIVMSIAPRKEMPGLELLRDDIYSATAFPEIRDPQLHIKLRQSKYLEGTMSAKNYDIWQANSVKIPGVDGAKQVFANPLQTNEDATVISQRHESWVLASKLNSYYRGMSFTFKSWLVAKINSMTIESVQMKRREQ